MSRFMLMAAAALVAVGCNERAQEPTGPLSVPVFTHGAGNSARANGGNFGTPLSGAEEVPVRETNARGNATFQLSADGQSMTYKLIVANIENVVAAHIHIGPEGVNGPVVQWLYPSTSPPGAPAGGGRMDGVIAEGTFVPTPVLLTAMQTGNAYVNVHTNDGVPPTNTGPGDFPGGEVRGQIEHRGH